MLFASLQLRKIVKCGHHPGGSQRPGNACAHPWTGSVHLIRLITDAIHSVSADVFSAGPAAFSGLSHLHVASLPGCPAGKAPSTSCPTFPKVSNCLQESIALRSGKEEA